MDLHPSQITKSNTNYQLLNLLIKRSQKSLQNSSKDWPGKHGPNLANVCIKRNNEKSVKVILKPTKRLSQTQSNKFRKTTSSKFIRTMPLIKMSSTSLSLQPTSRSKNLGTNSTWKTTQKTKFYQADRAQADQKQSENFSSTHSFKNLRVQSVFNNKNLDLYKKNTMLELLKTFQNQVANRKQNNVLNDYVIDFKTFNYIEKVIDNPQKWAKYVHKKIKQEDSESNQFLTNPPNTQNEI